jgi:hypothetical protein
MCRLFAALKRRIQALQKPSLFGKIAAFCTQTASTSAPQGHPVVLCGAHPVVPLSSIVRRPSSVVSRSSLLRPYPSVLLLCGGLGGVLPEFA